MELYGVGNMISYYREKNGLTQRQLCRGICTEATICRIETGCREFDSLISETLLERLGKTADRLEFVLNDEDYVLNELRCNILTEIREHRTEQAEKLLEKYEDSMPERDRLHQQFVLFARGLLLEEAEEGEAAVKNFEEALALTDADQEKKGSGMILYSSVEIELIYHLFCHGRIGIERVFLAFDFMEKLYDAEMKRQYMIPFLWRLLEQYKRDGDFAGIVRICEKAIGILNAGRSYEYLAAFYWEKLKAQEQQMSARGIDDNEKRELQIQGKTLYYMSMIEEDTKRICEIAEFCRERLGCQIIGQEI